MAKLLVGVKKCIDYAIKIRVNPNKKGVITAGIKHSMNPFDEIGVEEAVVMKEKKFAGEVIAITCGPKNNQDTLRTALAMGATSAIHVIVSEEDYNNLQPIHVSKALAKVAQMEKVDLVILGKQAIDDDSNQTAQMTAGLLDWPQATFCSKIQYSDKNLTATREVDVGLETIKLALPAVVSTDLRLNTPRYATLPNIIKAKKVPIKEMKMSDLVSDLAPRIEILSVDDPPIRKSGVIVKDVEELIKKIKDLKVIN